MKDFYEFASASPWLTFFLLSAICWCITESIKHLMAPFKKTPTKNEKARRTPSARPDGNR